MTTQILRRAPRFDPRRLAAARRAKGFTQLQTARAIERALRHYQRIESGEVGPTPAQLGQFAHLLDVTIDSLYATPEVEDSTLTPGGQ